MFRRIRCNTSPSEEGSLMKPMPSKEEVLKLVHELSIYTERYHRNIVLDDENDLGRYGYVPSMFMNDLNKYIEKKHGIISSTYIIHGELRHTPRIKSEYWVTQHKWLVMEYYGYYIYIDPISSQFNKLFNDIPDFYVSIEQPKWYYSYIQNIAYTKLGIKLNRSVRVHCNKDGIHYRVGLVEWFQYFLWGRISDILHNIFYREA